MLFRSYQTTLPTSLARVVVFTRSYSLWTPAADSGTIKTKHDTGPSGAAKNDDPFELSKRECRLTSSPPHTRHTLFKAAHRRTNMETNKNRPSLPVEVLKPSRTESNSSEAQRRTTQSGQGNRDPRPLTTARTPPPATEAARPSVAQVAPDGTKPPAQNSNR